MICYWAALSFCLAAELSSLTAAATSGGYCCSEDLLGGVTLARHGAGLLQTYRFIVEEDLQRGSMQEVLQSLQSFAGRSRPFSLLYLHGRHLPLRVRLFIDFLVEKLSH